MNCRLRPAKVRAWRSYPRADGFQDTLPAFDESLAEQQTAERHAAQAKRLPRKPETLWTFIHGLSDDDMGLLAPLRFADVNAIRAPRQYAD
ncbi:MAG: hypothetical protein QOJ51_917 [Acidobacteriaceae bacterium]|nr:hypothetical protein [Acidobacteriaceae bacterium]